MALYTEEKEREKYNKLLLELLNEIITVCPYMRIGQILSNAIPNIDTVYYLESNYMIKHILKYIKSHPEVFNDKINIEKYNEQI